LGKSMGSIEIEASPEKIFAFIISEKMNDVYKEYIEFKWTSAGPVGVGSTMHALGGIAARGRGKGEWNVKVTEFEENKKFTMRSEGTSKRALNSTNSYILEPTTKGTKVTLTLDYEMPYSVLGKLFEVLIFKKELEKQGTKMLENLKKAIET
jgi:hypothetical protein